MSKIAQPYQERQERLLPCEKKIFPARSVEFFPKGWHFWSKRNQRKQKIIRETKSAIQTPPARRHFSTSELRFLQAAVTKYLGHNRHNQLTQLTLPRTHACRHGMAWHN
jgi:hypothetical protein